MDELRFLPWADQEVDQVAVIPYRPSKQTGGFEFCLITASSGRWTFPKGNATSRKKLRATAEAEAWEEAGLEGKIDDTPYGCCAIRKGGKKLLAAVYLMEVKKSAKQWPERKMRRRIWAGPVAASALLTSRAQLETLQGACWEIEKRRSTNAAS